MIRSSVKNSIEKTQLIALFIFNWTIKNKRTHH